MPANQVRRTSPLLAALFLAAALAVSGPAAAQWQSDPDACTSELTAGTVTIASTASLDTNIFSTPGSLPGKKLVLLITDNCYAAGHYAELASHYARNSFVTALFDRHSVESLPALFDSLDFALAQLGLSKEDPDLKIGLVGHGVGGRLAIEAADLNTAKSLGYPIRAVATLAPQASFEGHLNGWDAGGFLAIYGSQDEYPTVYDSVADEAFAAYDLAGYEGSTTCSTPPCTASEPAFEKFMVYAYGADHAGLIGVEELTGFCGTNPQEMNFISAADGLCITKAYSTGFLRQHLWNDFAYQGTFRDEWRPLSIWSINTDSSDGFGYLSGQQGRLYFQISPVQKQSIQTFAGGLGTYTKTADAQISHHAAGSLTGSPHWVRHATDHVAVGWETSEDWQWVRFEVPAGRRDASNFSHFALRLGQIHGVPAEYAVFPAYADQSIWTGLEDASGQISWHQTNFIPPPDRAKLAGPVKALSHMATRRILLEDTARGFDLSDVRGVYLLFKPRTNGSLIVDSLEWHRD